MAALRDDLRLALDRVAFAEKLGIIPDRWQEEFLRSSADRVLLNCSRQSGKSTMSAVIALHKALYHPGSLVLCLAPALRQSQELFGRIPDDALHALRQARGVLRGMDERRGLGTLRGPGLGLPADTRDLPRRGAG